jgi:hypothetical protein
MKKISLLSSLFCSALLFGCGDDGMATATGATSNTTNTTNNGTDSAGTTTGQTTNTTNSTNPTTSAGGSTGDGGGTTGGSTGCSFLDCQGSSTGVGPGIECDVWTQDCPDGQKCMPWANDGGSSWNATKCTDVMPNPGAPGDECTVEGNGVSGIDSCEKASMCWNVSQDTGKGTCVAFCTGSQEAPMCGPGTNCVIANDGVLILCLPGCDPLTQDCPNMDLCIPQPMGDGFVCVLDASGDMGAQNDPCEYANACDPGLICANPALATECDPMAAGCCLPFCDLSMPECTNMGAMCLPWYDMGMAPPGLENVGVCGLPQ